MKKHNFFIFLTFLTLTTGLFIFSCSHDPDPDPLPVTCDTNNSPFDQLYNQTLTNPLYVNHVTYDSEVHSYTFEVLHNESICSVGYQSQPTLSTVPYLIEIWDVSNNILLGSVNTTFSSTATQYRAFPSSIPVYPGRQYCVKRIQTNWSSVTPYITSTIGRMLVTATGGPLTSLPFSNGRIKITGSSLYQNANTATNWGLPYIDIVFE